MPEPEVEPTETPTETPPEDWRGEHAKELAKFKTPAALGKSYLELEKAASAKVKIPDEEDTDGWQAFYGRLGRPETPDGYETQVPEGGNAEYVKTMQTVAHTAGLSKAQFAKLVEANNSFAETVQKAQTEEAEKLNTQRWERLEKEWGPEKRKENTELVQRLIAEIEDDEIGELITPDVIAKDPLLVKVISHALHRELDDKLIKGEQKTQEGEYEPQYKSSPDMYKTGDDEESQRARAWFEARGHKYS